MNAGIGGLPGSSGVTCLRASIFTWKTTPQKSISAKACEVVESEPIAEGVYTK